MARKQQDEAPAGSPAWMATFSDLMNLLLCFFVLLFSMSTVDAEKFQMVIASIQSSFSVLTGGTDTIGDGDLVGAGISMLSDYDIYLNELANSNGANITENNQGDTEDFGENQEQSDQSENNGEQSDQQSQNDQSEQGANADQNADQNANANQDDQGANANQDDQGADADQNANAASEEEIVDQYEKLPPARRKRWQRLCNPWRRILGSQIFWIYPSLRTMS